jgi:hypothetical protein
VLGGSTSLMEVEPPEWLILQFYNSTILKTKKHLYGAII